MVTAAPLPAAKRLTYESYMAEEEINLRYDILDGVRIYMPNPTRKHQILSKNIIRMFQEFEDNSQTGFALYAPIDVLISRIPLRTRQPDLLFICNARWAQNPPIDNPAPLNPAPELVVEIISLNETLGDRSSKLEDYASVGVLECWAVFPDTRSIQLLLLNNDGYELGNTFFEGDDIISIAIPDMKVPVSRIFNKV